MPFFVIPANLLKALIDFLLFLKLGKLIRLRILIVLRVLEIKNLNFYLIILRLFARESQILEIADLIISKIFVMESFNLFIVEGTFLFGGII